MGDKVDNKYNSSDGLWLKLLIAAIIVIVIWIISWVLIDSYIADMTDRGTFGDKFGAVNALFSGLAFAGLIVTLLYQKEELKLQREELAETRKELNAQRMEFQEQNKTLRRQRFENTFFNMLSLQQEIVDNLSYEYYESMVICPSSIPEGSFYKSEPKVKLRGRETFEGIYSQASIQYRGVRCMNGLRGLIQTFGCDVFSKVGVTTRFNHYFRHLCSIYEFVDSSDLISDEERPDYASIVRSQLSDCELTILFYACINTEDTKGLRSLAEKYQIFKDLRDDLLADASLKDIIQIN